MLNTLVETTRFLRRNDWRTILTRLNARDTHPVIQFIKYGICGVGALIIHQIIWTACSAAFFPAINNDIPRDVRALHSTYNNSIAFLFSNLFAYFTNVLWVFQQGRHHWFKEFLYFTLTSTLGFIAGLAAGPFLIHRYGIHSIVAQGLLVIVSVMVNFVCRKFFVFKH